LYEYKTEIETGRKEKAEWGRKQMETKNIKGSIKQKSWKKGKKMRGNEGTQEKGGR
jgi:hypothetical protein